MKNIQNIKGIKEIADLYEYFIFDIWGVVHDGMSTYPNVIETISYLRSLNKKICFLSNAPRRSIKAAEMLNKFGITSDLYDFILTSGEATFIDLKSNQDNGFKKFGKKYFYIGPKKDIDLLDGLEYEIVSDISLANFVITTGFENESSVLEEKRKEINDAKKFNLPMICVNPDMVVVRKDGKSMICAGAIASEYTKISGEVIYYGKPFFLVYEMVYKIFSDFINHFGQKLEYKKIIAIGDGLETDIKGANNFGIDSLLVTGGILTNHLKIKYWENADKNALNDICKSYDTFPKFVISNLKL